ncbi:MAG: SigE family RNA polymerase sigma factor [Mycobacteriales bacterium]
MGEPDADFRDFVLRRGPGLVRFAYALTGDRALAEDLVQEALAKAGPRWTSRRVHAPDAYVRTIIVRGHASWWRRASNRERPALTPDTVLTTADGAKPGFESSVTERDLVWRLLAGLSARQRAVLVLRRYEDLPDDEIAATLQCSAATVRSLAFRGLARLRERPELARPDRTTALAHPEEAP